MTVPQVMVSSEILQSLAPAADKLGISLPNVSRMVATIDVTKPIRHLALELGRSLSMRNIFLRATEIITVDPETGEIRAMTPKRSPSWAEEFLVFSAPGARRVRESLSVDDAAQILETDIFRSCLRPLMAVHLMVLPVQRASGEVEFLEPGYDEQSQIYTVEKIKYDRDWTLGRAQEYVIDVGGEFPWNRSDADANKSLGFNRSFSLHTMAMVGQYCKALFPPGALYPIIAYFANKPGTGKTRLAEMAVTPTHGYAAATGAPKDDEKMDVKLETIAQAMQPYVIFDDIGGGLRSNPLNRFTTESWHTGRMFHSNSTMFKVPNVTQVFVTANDLKTSEDIDRRALIVELFLDSEVKGRKFKRRITPQWLATDGTRAEFLAASCAFVRHWIKEGMPRHDSPLETYEDWTSVMAGIMMACHFADPLQTREGVVGGSMDEDEIRQMLIALASEKDEDCNVTRADLVETARKNGLLEDLIGTSGELDDTANKRFGRRMQRWRGQKLMDSRGRKFEFGHKRKKAGAIYPLTFLDLPAVTPPDAPEQ